MKVFQKPVIELVKLEEVDVITTSPEVDEGDLGSDGTDIA